MRLSTSTIKSLTGLETGQIQAFFLKQGEAVNQPFNFKLNTVPIDITNYTFAGKLREIEFSSASDTKNGYNISNPSPKTGSQEISIDSSIITLNAAAGSVSLFIPSSITALTTTTTWPVIFTGYFSVNNGETPAEVQKISLLIVVNNDGV